VSEVTELASGPITGSGDGITAQLIHPSDRQNQRDHDRLASCGKQVLDFGGRSKLQLFGGGPQHTAGAQKLTPKLHRAPLPSLD
jgi:hypothetical protein